MVSINQLNALLYYKAFLTKARSLQVAPSEPCQILLKLKVTFFVSASSWQIYVNSAKHYLKNCKPINHLCIRQRKPWTPPPQGSTQIRRRDDVESWGVYFQGLVNLDLINFLTMWIFTLWELRPGESWTNAVYISSENVLNTKIDCSKNGLFIVVLVEYKLKWMCC